MKMTTKYASQSSTDAESHYLSHFSLNSGDASFSTNNAASTNSFQSTPTSLSQTDTTTTAPYPTQTFQICLLVIAALGLIGNALVLFILASNKEARKKTTNLLIINQLALDLSSCALILISHSLQITSTYVSGLWGFVNCMLFISDGVPYIAMIGSIASLVIIASERYAKIVHPILHRKYFRKWMIYVGMAAAWINGALMNISVFWSTQVVDGICEPFTLWPDYTFETVYSVFVIAWQYFLPITLFAYFYVHIFVVIRRSNKLFAGPTGQPTDHANRAANSVQRNIIKTLITVTAVFAVCWGPNQIYFLLTLLNFGPSNTFYWWSVVFAFLNVFINPFVYAYKLETVRKRVNAWLCIGGGHGPQVGPAPTRTTMLSRSQPSHDVY